MACVILKTYCRRLTHARALKFLIHYIALADTGVVCYMAPEKGKKLRFPPEGLENFVPKVAQGTRDPKDMIEASPQ